MGNYGLILPPASYAVQKLNPIFATATHLWPLNEPDLTTTVRDLYNPSLAATVTNSTIGAGPNGLVRHNNGTNATHVNMPGNYNDNNWSALAVFGTRNWGTANPRIFAVGTWYTLNLQFNFNQYPTLTCGVAGGGAGAGIQNGGAMGVAGPLQDSRNPDLSVLVLRNNNRTLRVDASFISYNTSLGAAPVVVNAIFGPVPFPVVGFAPGGQVLTQWELGADSDSNPNLDSYVGGAAWWDSVLTDSQVASVLAAPFQAWPTALTGVASHGLSRSRGI